HLGAPEPVLALALVPGGAGVAGVLGIRVAKLVHREQEQAVADQGTRSPDIGLVEAAAVAAAPVDRGGGGAVRVFAGDDPVLARSLPRVGFEGQLDATFELVASRAGHCVDHAAGGAAELDRIATGLDLVFLEEREWCGGIALAPVEIGDVEA